MAKPPIISASTARISRMLLLPSKIRTVSNYAGDREIW